MEQEKSEEQLNVCSNNLAEVKVDEGSDQLNEEAENNSTTFDFTEKSWKTDFTLAVEGKKLYVAKAVLALASPVFDNIFQGEFKESQSDVLELPGKNVEDVKDFLRAFYPSSISRLSKEVALRVLPLAEEYQVLHLKRRCDEALLGYIDEFIPVEELFQILKAAALYDLKECLKKGVTAASKRSKKDIDKAFRKIVLPAEPFREIFQNLNDRLAKRVEELESSNSHLNAQLETCETVKNYLSNGLAKSQLLKLEEELVWTGKTFVFTMNLSKRQPVEDNVNICNITMRMKFDIQSWDDGCYGQGSGIYASIRNNEIKEIECNFKFRIVVVNKMPEAEHSGVATSFKFSVDQQKKDINVAKLKAIEDPKKGFVYEGMVQLEVNVLMSAPKQLKTKNILPDV